MIIIKLKQSILISILILFLSSSSYQGDAQPLSVTSLELTEVNFLLPAPINVDGILSPNEWDVSENITKFYLDADPLNYDGYNYMYLAEDADNLYVALDLVSDQTNDPDGEWIGIWLNTNNTISIDPDFDIASEKWADSLDKGMESLLFDVEKNMTIPFFDPTATTPLFKRLNSLNNLIAVEGAFEGSLADLQNGGDSNRANMTSEFNGTHYVYRLDVELPFNELFKVFPDLYLNNTVSVQMDTQTFNNVTIDEHYITIRDSSGNLLLESTDHTKSISLTTSPSSSLSIPALPGNFTQNEKVLFSYVGVNDAPFKTSFDRLYSWFIVQETTYLAGGWIDYPYSSIQDYEIAWSFGGSDNNATSHRMFELQIPKNELEGYSQDSDLGIIVGGYGTLSSFPNTANWVFANNTVTGMPFENSDEYHYYSMPMKGWVKAANPTLSAFDPNPSTTGEINLKWNTDPKIVNWTVLRYDSDITELNFDDVQILGTGLTTNQLNDSITTNGLYYYAVVGIDTLGYAYLSNVVSVSVEIPTSTSSTTSTTTTSTTIPTSSTIPPSSKESDDGFLPGFVLSSSFITIFVSMLYYRKRK